MLKNLLALFVLFSFIFQLNAEVSIKEEHRLKNIPPGYCAWISIETLALHHNLKPLIGLTQHRIKNHLPNGGEPNGINQVLQASKVPYKLSRSRDYTLLKESCDNDIGAVINLHNYPAQGDYHTVVLIDINDKEVKFIDSNRPKDTMKGTRPWFDKAWDGFAITFILAIKEEKPKLESEDKDPLKHEPKIKIQTPKLNSNTQNLKLMLLQSMPEIDADKIINKMLMEPKDE